MEETNTLENGAVVRFSHPLKFESGVTLDTFIILRLREKVVFLATVNYVKQPFEIPDWQKRSFSILNWEGKSKLTI